MSEVKNIFQRMSEITNELMAVAKNLNVGAGKSTYKAVGEADVLAAVKPIEYKHGVYSYPIDREIVESEKFEKTSYEKITVWRYFRMKTTYRFVNVDKPDDFIDQISYSDGIDSGDKGTGKAMTYGDKYALLKAYKITTGEDPDQKHSKDIEQVRTQKEEELKIAMKEYTIGCTNRGLNTKDVSKILGLGKTTTAMQWLAAINKLDDIKRESEVGF